MNRPDSGRFQHDFNVKEYSINKLVYVAYFDLRECLEVSRPAECDRTSESSLPIARMTAGISSPLVEGVP